MDKLTLSASPAFRSSGQVPGSDRAEFIAEVASLYYEERLDQQEIARRIGVSRSTVSRLLHEAVQSGIVEIRVRRSLPLVQSLQNEIVREFGIRDALVLATRAQVADNGLTRLGRAAARYLDGLLADGDVLAISWGTGVRAVADGLKPRRPRSIEVVQMLGGAGSRDPEVDGTELARRLAGLLGGRCRYLNVPLVVDDPGLALALLRQRGVRETLGVAARADVALVGIGALVPAVSSLLRAGHLTRKEINEVRHTGAVGDVCGHLFTGQGDLVDAELTRRIVAIEVNALQRIPQVIGVASGLQKVEAILGALRARLVNVIVTDDVTAHELITRQRAS